jgi:very-short-patch-repair endonuclease
VATRTDAGDPSHVVDQRIVAFVAGREGVATTGELRRLGVTRAILRDRIRRGWLIRRHSGVYLVGPLTGPFSEEMAAVVAIGADAALSLHAGAALWRMRPAVGGPIDVSVQGRHARSRPGIRVHNVRAFERTVHRGIPVTTPAWTLLDLAAILGADDLARAVEEARVLGLVSPAELERLPRRPGRAALLDAVRVEPRMTRSEAERRLLALVRRAGLPTPRTNVRVAGHEVDALWPRQRLIAEVDGFAAHGLTRAQFERDRARDAQLVAAGHRVIRITWRQLRHEPEAIVANLAAALAQV